MNRADELRLRLEAVELLRLLHRWWSLRELEEITGLPRGVLAHYVSGNR
ncbi:MAG TPA: phosphoribosyltransferase, partial [Pyrodictium sp.]|nr:phosphoribosyltransferase [Pyrodictium sp.]